MPWKSRIDRRQALRLALGGALSGAFSGVFSSGLPASSAVDEFSPCLVPDDLRTEISNRIARAAALMQAGDLDAILIEPGSTMVYFSGISWWRSERLTALIITKNADVGVVTPYFEEPSVQQSLRTQADVRTWHEDASPFAAVAAFLADKGIKSGKIGLERTVRRFVSDGLTQDASGYAQVSAEPVVNGCRMIKTAYELIRMQRANDITLAAYAKVWPQVEAGMRPMDIKALMARAQKQLGGASPWALALVGKASAYPHGSSDPQIVKEGEILLMDCGCTFDGYKSDISRTFVYGAATAEQRTMWQHMRTGQDKVLAAARVGASCGSVDDAVRAYYESLGYGPDYKTPGLSHRTGHGIGMDGHEPVNLVRGEATKLAPGMCFSNEPGLYDFSRYGVRLEDCFYITEDGPRYFTHPPESLEKPIGWSNKQALDAYLCTTAKA